MRAVRSDAGVRASVFAIRCCVLVWGLVCVSTLWAAEDSDETAGEFDEPLCRRNHNESSSSNWQLKADAPALVNAVRALELPHYLSRNTLDHQRAFSWSGVQEFRFNRDLNEWHRLRAYGSRNAVRVVTLWNSNSTTLALQADKHGDPMLRWTSKELSRGEASRGLLDDWLSSQ